MLSAAVVGTCFIVSIGTLMAHAVDAFRNRLPRQLDGTFFEMIGIPSRRSNLIQ
jgi:hypothetical protein